MGELIAISDLLGKNETGQTSQMTPTIGKNYSEVRRVTVSEVFEEGLKPEVTPYINCEFCNATLEATGLIADLPWGRRFIFREYQECQCDEAIEARKAAAEKKQQAEECRKKIEYCKQINRLKQDSQIGKRFMQRTFSTFNETEENREVVQTAKQYAEQFPGRLNDGVGLLFTGTYGTGKTHLAVAICHEVISQGHLPVFGTMISLLDRVKATFQESSLEAENEVFKKYTTCDLLVIDDLGKEKPTEWAVEKLYHIINARYEECLPIIVTTNYSLAKLTDRLTVKGDTETAEAIISRIHETLQPVYMTGSDYRKGDH